jgi:hypothetical protein
MKSAFIGKNLTAAEREYLKRLASSLNAGKNSKKILVID